MSPDGIPISRKSLMRKKPFGRSSERCLLTTATRSRNPAGSRSKFRLRMANLNGFLGPKMRSSPLPIGTTSLELWLNAGFS